MSLQKKALANNKKVLLVLAIILAFLCTVLVSKQTNATDMCVYHQQHNEECGYVAPVEGSDCQHEHSDECYKQELVCTQDHEHSDECYQKVLVCHHQHDDTCGYKEAVAGHECEHRCVYCNDSLIKEGKITYDIDNNTYTIHIHSELEGTSTDDQLYYYIKFDKSLLDKMQLESQNNTYFVRDQNYQGITLTPVYLDNDDENVYLKYSQKDNSILDFDLIFISESNINKYFTLNYASSLHEDNQIEVCNQFVIKYPESSESNVLATSSYYSNSYSLSNTDTCVDLTPYLTSVTGHGTEYDPATDSYTTSLRIDFNMTVKDIKDANYLYEYELPEGIVVPENLLNKTYTGYDGEKESFKYAFIKDDNGKYHIQIQFLESYLEGYSEETTVPSHIQFKAGINSNKLDESGNIEIIFKDDLNLDIPASEIIYPDNETHNYSLRTSKSGTYDKESNTITYTVYIESDKGTPGPIDLVDNLSANGVTVENISITSVEKLEKNEWESYVKTGVNVENEINIDNTGLKGTLPQLGEGEGYLVTYQCTLSDLGNSEISGTVSNAIQTSSSDENTGETVKSDSSSSVWISTQVLSKFGTYDSSTKKCKWNITVNGSGNDIVGAQLTDEMFGEMTEEQLRNAIQPENGYTIIKDSEGKISGIEFIATDGGKNKNTYTISYETDSSVSWDENGTDKTIKNTATFDPTPGEGNSGDETVSEGSVYVSEGNISKSLVEATEPDSNNNILITWKVEIEVPSGGIKSGTVIKDCPGNTNGLQWMTYNQIIDLINSLQNSNCNWPSDKTKFSFSDCTWDDPNATYYTYDQIAGDETLQEKKFTYFKIEFTDDYASADEKIYFTYQTYGNVSNVINEESSSQSLTNNISVGNKNSSASYEFRKKVVKTDGNGNAKDTSMTTQDGYVSWKVLISLDKDCNSLQITDTLPNGVTLDSLSYEHNWSSINAIIEDKTISGGDATYNSYFKDIDVSGSISDQTVNLSLTLKSDATRPETFTKGSLITITYKCKIDNFDPNATENQELGTFKNTVSVHVNNDYYGSDNQEQTITQDVPKVTVKEVDKNYIWNNESRKLSYSIDINPEAKDYIEKSDQLTLIDTLTYYQDNGYANRHLSLVHSSVKLYYAQTDENGVPLKDDNDRLIKAEEVPIDKYKWTYSELEDEWNLGKIYCKITASIPDEFALIFEYKYDVQMDPQNEWDASSLKVSNSVVLEGLSGMNDSSSTSDSEKWQKVDTEGGSSLYKKFILYKVDSNDYSFSLEKAEFTLYEYNTTSGSFVETNPVQIYQTNNEGKFEIKWQSDANDFKFKEDTAYKIIETKAPSGYELSSDSPPEYGFYFSSSSSSSTSVPEGADENFVDLTKTSRTVYCENTRPVTNIKVNKLWQDRNGNTLTSDIPDVVNVSLKRYAIPQSIWDKLSFNSGQSDTTSININLYAANTLEDNSPILVTKPSSFIINSSYKVGSQLTLIIKTSYSGSQSWLKCSVNGEEQSLVLIDGYAALEYSFIVQNSMSLNVLMTTDANQFEYFTYLLEETDFSDIQFSEEDLKTIKSYSDSSFSSSTTIKSKNDWEYTFDNLPLYGEEKNEKIYYLYYVEEDSVAGFRTEYSNNNGINNGDITITNIQDDSIMLPETGGFGTLTVILSGLTMICFSLLCFLKKKLNYRKVGEHK